MKYIPHVEIVGDGKSSTSPNPNDANIMSLEYVVQRYGGLNVELPVPGGPTVPLSLSHLANMNHSTTFVKMRVELVPEGENELDDYSAKMDSIERRRKA